MDNENNTSSQVEEIVKEPTQETQKSDSKLDALIIEVASLKEVVKILCKKTGTNYESK